MQSCSNTETGDTTFYRFDTFRESRQSVGKTDFYYFDDGSSTTRNSVGDTDFYSGSRPSLSGSTNWSGNTTFGNWDNGTTSTHQSVGGMTFHNFSNGRNCTRTHAAGSLLDLALHAGQGWLVLVVSAICARRYGAGRARESSTRGEERVVSRPATRAAVGVAEEEIMALYSLRVWCSGSRSYWHFER